MRRNVLFISENTSLRETFCDFFGSETSINCLTVPLNSSLEEMQEQIGPELIIVDLETVFESGKYSNVPCPILFLTPSKTSLPPKHSQLQKPFYLGQLKGKVEEILAETPSTLTDVVSFGPYHLLIDSRVLCQQDGEDIRLTEKEVDILKTLYESGETPLSKSTLLKHVWQFTPGMTTHTVETHIYRLRQKIEKNPLEPCYLKTTEKGYILKT